jgi:FkbM family methyltransferase
MMKYIKKILGETTTGKLKNIKNKIILDKNEIQLRRKRIEFYSKFINEGDVCFDVGANVGNRVYPLLKLKAKVVAIEPQQICFEELEKKFGDKIKLVKKGLGEKEEIKEFFISSSSTLSTFSKDYIDSVKNGRFSEYEWNKVETVEMTTLDNLIKGFGVPKFIKIDVEGYELEVLKGLNSPVEMISFEYFVPEQLIRVSDCINRVREIDQNIEINYSIGESMEFALDEWISFEEMIEHINQPNFMSTDFGDIYIRNYKVKSE